MKIMTVRVHPIPLALGALLAGVALPAAAQTEGSQARVLEEVTVTARRFEESLQDTPVSVSAFGQHELEQMGISEVRDIAQATPNLDIRKLSGGQPAVGYSIRGISNQDDSISFDGTVGVYVDGVYVGRQSSTGFAIFDVERIEVLRGPQGTLFGRNTIGGAVNIVTTPPRDEFAFKQKIGAGNRGQRNFQTAIDTGRYNGLAARLSILDTRNEGDRKDVYTNRKLDESKTRAYRLAVNWTPSDAFSVDYSYERSEWESGEPIAQLTFVRDMYASPDGAFYGGPYWEQARDEASSSRLDRLPRAAKNPGDWTSDIDGHALTLTWDPLPNLTIKSITGYRSWDEFTPNSTFGGAFPADGSTLLDLATFQPIPAGTLVPLYQSHDRDRSQDQWSQELQFVGTLLDDRLRYNTGLYYFREKSELRNPQAFVLPTCLLLQAPPCGTSLLVSAPFLHVRPENVAYAAYGEFTYELIPDLDVTLGLRYSVDDRELDLFNLLDNVPQRIKPSNDWNNLSPSATVSYRWSDQLSTYAKVVTGYRSGGFNMRATTVESASLPFDEEEVISYEIGWKSDLLDRTLRFNGAVFYTDYKDRQISQFQTGNTGAAQVLVNAGRSANSGIELEATWLPIDALKLNASYGYTDINFDSFVAGEVDPVSGFSTGRNVDIADSASTRQNTPNHNGSISAEYSFPRGDIGELTLRLDTSYTGEIDFHPQLTLYNSSDSFWLTNARATLSEIPAGRNGRLSIGLWVRNLENEEYREFGIDWGQLGFVTNSYNPERTFGADLVYEFNR